MKNIYHKTIFVVSVIMVICAGVSNAQTNNRFKFEPSKSTIPGTIVVETFYDANGKKENSYILKLDRPIKVIADPNDDLNSTTNNVTKVQLVAGINLSIYKNKKVNCTGTFFSAITAHHHTDVLMNVEIIQDRK